MDKIEAFLTSFWTGLSQFILNYGFKILGALLILIIGPFIIKWIVKIIKRSKKFSTIDPNTQTLIIDIIKAVLYVFLVALIASTIGIAAAAIAAAVASCGLAIGLALQGSLSNCAGGIMILIFKPFRVGDFIESNGQLGIVKDIGIFYTVIHTPDNKVVTMPNGSLANAVVIDYSVNPIRRVDFKLRVDYDSDIEVVKAALFDLAEAHDLVIHDDPEHTTFVTVGEQTESALVFYFRVWVKNEDYWTAYFDIMGLTKQVFDARGITIPRPQLDVHMKDTKDEQ